MKLIQETFKLGIFVSLRIQVYKPWAYPVWKALMEWYYIWGRWEGRGVELLITWLTRENLSLSK